MSNQPRTLANKLAAVENTPANENDIDNDNEETMSAEPLEEKVPNVDDVNAEEQPENIKSVELKGKDAVNLNNSTNSINSAKKPVPIGTLNSNSNNNLSRKKNNNQVRNLTQRQTPNVNVATEEDANSNSGDKTVMRSLNKVAMNLLNHQIIMKLFHFQTELYGAHKASDAYLEKFATTMDKFLEIAQGIYGRLTIKKFKLEGSSHTDENIMKHIEGIIMLLRTGIDDVLDKYTDLINIRDELVGDAEQLKYLLSFK